MGFCLPCSMWVFCFEEMGGKKKYWDIHSQPIYWEKKNFKQWRIEDRFDYTKKQGTDM